MKARVAVIALSDARERERLEMQERLDAERSPAARNASGQFATPTALADAIVRACVAPRFARSDGVRGLEPSMGSGAFVGAVLRAMSARVASVTGVELDPRFADAARALWTNAPLRVIDGDFTRMTPAARVDLVVANPPYVRHHHLDAKDKVRLQALAAKELDLKVSGLAGLYVHFILRAHAWMDDGALGVWLIPSEWMDVNYGSALRRYLTERVSLVRVHRFQAADVRFEDALVSSSVVCFEKRASDAGDACRFTGGPSIESPTTERALRVGELRGRAKWGPLFAASAPTVTAAHGAARVSLGDLVRVSRGIATGANDFFIRPREEFRALGVPARFLRPVLPSSRYLDGAEIEADDEGWPRLDPVLALLDCDLSEETVRAKHPRLWAYLDSPAGRAASETYLGRGRDPWYAQEKRAPAPVVVTYMGRGRKGAAPFRFFWNRSQAIATNVWLMLAPKPVFAQALARRPELARDLVAHLAGLDRASLVGHGRVYGGGLHKIEPRELAALDVTEWAERHEVPEPPRP